MRKSCEMHEVQGTDRVPGLKEYMTVEEIES